MDAALLERLRGLVHEQAPLPAHLIRTEWWLERLRPDADDALRVAALLHDVDRLFPFETDEAAPSDYRYDDRESLLWHGRRSARFARRILEDLGADEALVEQVLPLIVLHEIGGESRVDTLMEADSLSFLENNVGYFLRKITADATSVRTKVDFMFRRIRSAEAQELALPLYEQVIAKLNTVVPGSIETDGSLDETGVPVHRPLVNR